tara:strand:+ start:246 stop:533 length:288 start_codon:yes stop_codon:yes gene_type:complete
MGVMRKAIKLAMDMGAIQKVGERNRQEMFGAGQKPEDYQQGPTMSQNMGVKSMGVASPNMQDQYARYLEEEEVRKKKKKTISATDTTGAGTTLLG